MILQVPLFLVDIHLYPANCRCLWQCWSTLWTLWISLRCAGLWERRGEKWSLLARWIAAWQKNDWAVLSDEQMSNGWQFSLLNDEQMSNKVRVEHQPDEFLGVIGDEYPLLGGSSQDLDTWLGSPPFISHLWHGNEFLGWLGMNIGHLERRFHLPTPLILRVMLLSGRVPNQGKRSPNGALRE